MFKTKLRNDFIVTFMGCFFYASLCPSIGWSAHWDKIDFLCERLKNSSSIKVRIKAASHLGDTSDKRTADALVKALKDKNYAVRAASARALSELGCPLASNAVEDLFFLIGHENKHQLPIKEARRALERLVCDESRKHYAFALNNNKACIRLVALQILASKDGKASRSAVISALGDEDNTVHHEALRIIKRMDTDDQHDMITKALDFHTNYRVQATAATLAGEIRDSSLIDKLSTLLLARDIVPEVKKQAVNALSRMKQCLVLSELISELNSENTIQRNKAIRLLGIHGGYAAVNALIGLLSDKSVCWVVVAALRDAKNPRAILALESTLNSIHDPHLTKFIEHTLSKLKV